MPQSHLYSLVPQTLFLERRAGSRSGRRACGRGLAARGVGVPRGGVRSRSGARGRGLGVAGVEVRAARGVDGARGRGGGRRARGVGVHVGARGLDV